MHVWNAGGTETDSRFIAIQPLVRGKYISTYSVLFQNPAVFPPTLVCGPRIRDPMSPVSEEHHPGSLICSSLSLGALGRENEEKFPWEQEFHRLEEVVLALLHLFGGNKQEVAKLVYACISVGRFR